MRFGLRYPFVFVATISLVAVQAALPAAGSGSRSSELSASSSLIVAGDTVQLSGALSGDAPCLGLRSIVLQWRQNDTLPWTTAASGTTADNGTFAFTGDEQYTGRYWVRAPLDGSCAATATDPIRVRVRARVESAIIASSLVAGSCPSVQVTVTPPKAAQQMQLQRLVGATWQTFQTFALDDSSSAGAKPCLGWGDIGVVQIRARWPQQDGLNTTGLGDELALQIDEAAWMKKIDQLVAGHAMSVSVGRQGSFLYRRADTAPRTPASNEKLLLSMSLLSAVGPDLRIETHAAAASFDKGVVPSNLWILGRGDPGVTGRRMGSLARQLVQAGLKRVRGGIMGSTTFFRHDWWARGWKRGRTRLYVAPPTALTFDGNTVNGRFTSKPELWAARSLTKQLEKRGVRVAGLPGRGAPPAGLTDLAVIRSASLHDVLSRMNRPSDNFSAEVLGKLLGVETYGEPGTIAKGAAAIRAWTASHGVDFTLFDDSGLSYANRVTAVGMVRLLWVADGESWGPELRQGLATGGQGTLEDRLLGVRVRAKTGTLDGISALSGWVWLDRDRGWGEFSILSGGMPKWKASSIEDRIVRILANSAR